MSNSFLQFLGLTKKAGKLVEGYNKCEEIIQKKRVFLVILSLNVSVNTKDKFERYCKYKNVKLIQCNSSEELGEATGRSEVNVLCVTDKAMAEKLLTLYGTTEINRG